MRHLVAKFLLSASSLLVVSSLSTPFPTRAQQPQPQPPLTKYATLEFIKFDPGQRGAYLRMEREIWMPIHRQRIKMGLIKSWSLWSARIPGGTNRDYDMIIITTFDKFSDIENSYPQEVLAKAFPDMTPEQVSVKMSATRKMVRTEVVTVLDSTPAAASTQLPKYAYIGYMKPESGKALDYVEIERKYWKPIHQERVNRGIVRSWTLYSVRLPGGSEKEYTYFTIQLYDRFQDLETQYPEGIWEKVHPSIKEADISTQTNAVRKMVKTELMTLTEQVQ